MILTTFIEEDEELHISSCIPFQTEKKTYNLQQDGEFVYIKSEMK